VSLVVYMSTCVSVRVCVSVCNHNSKNCLWYQSRYINALVKSKTSVGDWRVKICE